MLGALQYLGCGFIFDDLSAQLFPRKSIMLFHQFILIQSTILLDKHVCTPLDEEAIAEHMNEFWPADIMVHADQVTQHILLMK